MISIDDQASKRTASMLVRTLYKKVLAFPETFKGSISHFNRLSPNIVIFIIYGLLYDIVINIYKPFAIKFLTRLGGNANHITLYNSLPGIVAAFVLIPGAIFISRFSNRKKVTSIIFFISRLFLLVIAFVPFLPETMRPMAFIILISLMSFPEALSQTSLQSSLGNFFTQGNIRAIAISLRNKFGNFIIPFITFITGVIISTFPKSDQQVLEYYQVFFAIAFLIGLYEIRTFSKFKEESNVACATKPSLGSIKHIFRDKKFMKYTFPTIVFYITWHGGWALSGIYQIEKLGADEFWFAIFAVASGFSSFLTAGFWSKMINRIGNDKTLIIASFGMALNMFFTALSPNLSIMFITNVYTGFVGIGLNIALLNGLLEATPDQNRMIYISLFNTLTNISLGISPLVVLLVLNRVGITATLYVVGTARLCSAAFLLFCNIMSHSDGLKPWRRTNDDTQ